MRRICDGAVFDFSILSLRFPQEIASVFPPAVCFSDIHSAHYDNQHGGHVQGDIIKKQICYWLYISPRSCPHLSYKIRLTKNGGRNIRYIF